MADENTTYQLRVEQHVRRALANQPSCFESFESVCRSCHGAFPVDVLAALKRLLESGSVSKSQVTFNSGSVFSKSNGGSGPEPSPMDYEWRFTKDSAKDVSKLAGNLGTRIICLGTPSVFGHLLSQNADAYLIDRNPFITVAFRQIAADKIVVADVSDFNRVSSLGKFDVIVMDPPWYQNHIRVWLHSAIGLGRKGAKVIMTLFPDLVRPTAWTERSEVLDLLAGLGEFSVLSKGVEYETPRFESETLAAMGIRGLYSWRLADLVALSLNGSFPVKAAAPLEQQRWERFRFGDKVVGLDQASSNETNITVESPYPDGSFVLKSISMRDPIKSRIGFWTSRNRAAIVKGNQRIGGFLRAVEAGAKLERAKALARPEPKEEAALEKLLALIGLKSGE